MHLLPRYFGLLQEFLCVEGVEDAEVGEDGRKVLEDGVGVAGREDVLKHRLQLVLHLSHQPGAHQAGTV